MIADFPILSVKIEFFLFLDIFMKRFIFILFIFLFSSCLYPGQYRDEAHFKNTRYRENVWHNRKDIVKTAKQYIGVVYKHGGNSPEGFDCSGFVQYVYKKNGINLPRSARNQYYGGKKISLGNLRPGDLVFYHTEGKGVNHVVIFIGEDQFIHAPSTGKAVSIVNMEINYWKERYIGSTTYFY
jgi:cell wall-associated NlpC family hydrolase